MTTYGSDLAQIHDEGFGFVAQNAACVLLSALHDASFREGTVVDLGCGSGILSKLASDAGYRVHGVDYSEDMIRLARARIPEGEFVQGSVLDAKLPECVAVAAVGEVFNYAFDERAGLQAFAHTMKSIFEALVPGGIFLFDIAGPGRAGDAPRMGFVDHDDWSIVHRAAEHGDTLTRDITTFTQNGNFYRRNDERHVLRLYRPSEVLDALTAAGFTTTQLDGYADFNLPVGWHAFLARKPLAYPSS